MKRQNRYVVAVLVALASMGTLATAGTLPASQNVAITRTLSAVKAPELASTAASLVKGAAKADREATAVAVVQAVIAQNPTAVIPVISAIVRVAPATAAAVATAAAKLLPEETALIARAATIAAPEMAVKIMSEMAQQSPTLVAQIEQAVASAAPSQSAKLTAVRLSDKNADTITTFQTPIGFTLNNPVIFPVTPPAPQIFVTTIPPNTPRTYAAP